MTENARRVLAMELLSAAQGIDLLRPLKSTKTLEQVHALVRKHADYAEEDRAYYEDLARLECMIDSNELKNIIEKGMKGTRQ